ncbi:MAG: hypothetical protein QUU85_13725, partial [Candidatus Eisenbacteria bacterium]|nr:hypothetical protein [Candidatus Eisenbacteria bacterium]
MCIRDSNDGARTQQWTDARPTEIRLPVDGETNGRGDGPVAGMDEERDRRGGGGTGHAKRNRRPEHRAP